MTMNASITSGQETQLDRFGEDAGKHAIRVARNKIPLDKDATQRLLMRGDEFKSVMADAAIAAARELALTDRFKDEEVESSYVYPAGYQPKPLEAQIEILRGKWPKLNAGAWIAGLEKAVPPGAEFLSAFVRWEALAPTYNDAVNNEILPALSDQRGGKFKNWWKGQLGPDRLRQNARTKGVLERIASVQQGDILVTGSQFGMLHRGRSVRRAREILIASEFGHGSFTGGCLLLTHPERLVSYDDLWLDLPGDDYRPGGKGEFVGAPYFDFRDGELRFDAGFVDAALKRYGSVSGCSLQ